MRLALAIGLVTLAIYAPVASAPFVYEDRNWIGAVEAGSTHGWHTWPSRVPWPNRWATHTSYQIQGLTQPIDPRRFHLANVALHLLCGVCVWLLARSWRLSSTACLIAMALFLWHPLNTGAVAYVSGRSDVLMALFTLLAVVSARFWGWAALPVVLGGCVLAGASKELGALAIVLVLLSVGAWRWMWQAVAVVAPLGLWYVMRWPDRDAWIELVTAQAVSLWRVLGLVVVPIGLSIDPDPWMVPFAWRCAALVALPCVALWVWRRPSALERWAGAWVGVVLLPRLVIPTYEPVHDQHAYLAMAAISVALAARFRGEQAWSNV